MELVIIGTRDATIAGAAANVGGISFYADGTAKRDPHDNDNVEVAELLAAGRALEVLSAKMIKRANGLVKHADDMRQYKELQKQRPTKKKAQPYGGSKAIAKVKAKR